MKKLNLIILALLMAQIPSEILPMKGEDGGEKRGIGKDSELLNLPEPKRQKVATAGDSTSIVEQENEVHATTPEAAANAVVVVHHNQPLHVPNDGDPFLYLTDDVLVHILSFVPDQLAIGKINKKFARVVAGLDNLEQSLKILTDELQPDFQLGNNWANAQGNQKIVKLVNAYFLLREIKRLNPYVYSLKYTEMFGRIYGVLLTIVMYPRSMVNNSLPTVSLGVELNYFYNLFDLLNYGISVRNLNLIKFLCGCLPTNGEKYIEKISWKNLGEPLLYDWKKGSPFLAVLVHQAGNSSFSTCNFDSRVLQMWELLANRPEIKQYLQSKGVKTSLEDEVKPCDVKNDAKKFGHTCVVQ